MNLILQHWQKPYHREHRSDADLHGHSVGTVCGDEIDLYLFVVDGVIQDAFFNGEGCTISLGMASLLTEWLSGQSIDAARRFTESEVLQLANMEIDRRRHGCALVAFNALQLALGF